MFGMFLIAFWEIRTLKCDAVNFIKFEWASVPVRPSEYLDAPILIIAHASCMCVCNAHAHCDVTGFVYDANHIIMMSPVFAFHSCHVETRWHDIIGVRVVGTTCHHL